MLELPQPRALRLVALDLDGILLRFSARIRAALQAAEASGLTILVGVGRSLRRSGQRAP